MGTAALLSLLAVAPASADDPETLRSRAERLRSAADGLEARKGKALLELYSLETRLAAAERRLEALAGREAALERLEASARERLDIARSNMAQAERRLATRLRTLYVEGELDPLAVLLGAESFGDALTALDGLGRLAADDKAVVAEVRAARGTFQRTLRELSDRRAELEELVAEARAARDSLAQALAERAAFVGRLRGRQAFAGGLVRKLLSQAAAAEAKTEEIAAAQAPIPVSAVESTPVPAPPSPASGTRMIVSSTGYCLHGTTATGMQAGWGTIAVDPSVIPLGTKMHVPGYGNGVAADTGAAVKGRAIDVWFPTCSQALAWGLRTVTITLG